MHNLNNHNFRIMPQRWMKILAFFTAATLLVSACKKSEFSKDEKLPETFSTSLFISSQNQFLYALDPRTGAKQWEYYIGDHVEATPVVIGEFLFLPTTDSMLKIDAKRGKLVKKMWLANTVFTQFVSSPAVDGNNIIIGSLNDTMYSVNTVTENINWRFFAGGDIVSSPTIHNGQVIFAANSKVYALDLATGAMNWEFGAGAFTSSPVVSAPHVFIGSVDGKLYVLDVATGAARWDYDTKAQILSSPIVYGGNVIFGSNNAKLYCLDTAARKERWIYETSDRIVSSPTADRNIVYFGSYDYYCYALDVIDGKEKWKFQTNALIKSSPLVYNGVIYFGSHDKNMYAFDSTGVLHWKHNINGLIESSPIIWDLEKTFYPSISGMSQL